MAFRPPPNLDCRLFGHSWDPVPSDWTPSFGVPMTLRCMRCTMERRDICQRTGELLSRRYTYPEGYLYNRAEERPTRVDFRRMWLDQHLREVRAARKRANGGGK